MQKYAIINIMKIGIDVFGCDHGQSGLGSYVLFLVKNLPLDKDCTYDLFGPENDRYTFDSGDGRNSYSGIDIPDNAAAETFWHTFKLDAFAAKKKYDAILFPAGLRSIQYAHKIPSVVVIHDIVSETVKKSTNKVTITLRIASLKHFSKIIAPSQFIRKDLTSLKVNPDKIEVIYNGIDHNRFYPRKNLSIVADGQIESADATEDIAYIQPFAIKRPYLIYASRLSKPEKKHVELIQAFSIFKEKTGLPHRLVLAGSEDPYAEEIHRIVSASPYSSDILITGYFPSQNFFELYAFSDACLFPSVSEGVGLPIIEAMSSGVPVACAKAGALNEIAGDSALYFDPDDIAGFAVAIEQIATDEKLRAKLIKSGLEWTKRFSWEKTAEKTVDLLKSLVIEN